MRATITRKLVESTIKGFAITIQENGEPSVQKLEPVTVYGKIGKNEAVKELKRLNPDLDGITVSAITEEEVQFEITVEDFVKNAKRLDKKNEKEIEG